MTEMVNPVELRRLMSEATEGPWLSENQYVGLTDFWICRCFSEVDTSNGEIGGEGDRNAAFIAILPDLAKAYLALLERDARIVGMIRNGRHGDGWSTRAVMDIWNELAKEANHV